MGGRQRRAREDFSHNVYAGYIAGLYSLGCILRPSSSSQQFSSIGEEDLHEGAPQDNEKMQETRFSSLSLTHLHRT